MPQVPPELETLDALLHQGLEALLREAQKLDVLEPPFGRPPLQLPLDEYQAAADDDDDDDDEDEDDGADEPEEAPLGPVFKYDYGFNPLMFLAKFLSKNNPKNIAARELEYAKSARFLLDRARFAMLQNRTFGSLQEMVAQMRSGVTHGPVAGDVTFSGATLWARACKPCKLVFELAATAAFENILECEVGDASDATGLCGRVSLANLHSSFTYHYRVCAMNPPEGLPGPGAGYFITGRFTTLPDSEETRAVKLCFAPPPSAKLAPSFLSTASSADAAEPPSAFSAMAALEPTCLLVLGGLLPRHAPGVHLHKLTRDQAKELQLTQMRDPRMRALLASAGTLVAWSDDAKGAAAALAAEEQATTKSDKDKRRSRTSKKEAADPRGELAPALAAMQLCWPLALEDKVTRHAFSARKCGTLAEIFLVDTRGGAIGKTQAAWLADAVPQSPCLWKIVVTGAPLSVNEPVEPEAAGAGLLELGADPELDAAAAKIQSRQRGRLARRGSSSAADAAPEDAKSKDSSSTRRTDDKAGGKGPATVQVAEADAPKLPTLYEVAVALSTEQRVPNLVFVSGASAPFAVSYEGAASDAKKPTRVLEFGAAPLGHGKTKKATWCESLRPTHLVPAWAEANQHGTFGCLAITEQGELQFTVHNAEAQKLYGAAVHPSKRR